MKVSRKYRACSLEGSSVKCFTHCTSIDHLPSLFISSRRPILIFCRRILLIPFRRRSPLLPCANTTSPPQDRHASRSRKRKESRNSKHHRYFLYRTHLSMDLDLRLGEMYRRALPLPACAVARCLQECGSAACPLPLLAVWPAGQPPPYSRRRSAQARREQCGDCGPEGGANGAGAPGP